MSRICLGIDNGHYAHKVYDHAGKMSTVLSRAKLGENQMVSMMADNKSASMVIASEGVTYTCGKIRRHEEVNPKTFPQSPLSRILLHYAISQHEGGKFLTSDNVHVCAGIPLGRYFKSGKPVADDELVKSVTENLSKPVTLFMPDGSELTKEINVVVKPQTFVAWYAYILEEKRNDSDPTKPKVIKHEMRMKEPVAMIDIGGGTTEICVIEDAQMDMAASGSEFIGSNDVRLNLEKFICDKYQMDSISTYLVDVAMQTKKLVLDGDEIDVSDLHAESFSQANAKLINFIQNKLGTNRQRELNAVRLIGGGCVEFKHAIESAVRRSSMVPFPQHENAKGMYLMQRYLNR
jgi:hypothetical protein